MMLAVTPVAASAQDRNVTIVVPAEPAQLDPCHVKEDVSGRVLLDSVVQTLTVRDIETGELQPSLATSWEQVDDLTWRFKLREGVKFHDGTAMTAGAVKASIDRTMNPDLVCQTRTKFFGDRTLQVAAVDENTIDIKTEEFDPIMPVMASTIPVYSLKGLEIGTMSRDIGGGGTGPYRLADWQAGQHIVLERNPDYWGDEPVVERATFVWRPESSVRAAMVAQGEADLAPIISPEDVSDAFKGVAYPNAETTRINLDLLLPPTSDKRVRAAINFAIDRESLKVTVGPDVIIATHMFVPQVDGYNPDIPMIPYKPELAKALIEDARADGVEVDREIEFVGRTNHFPGDFELIQAVTAMLKDVGLNVRVQMYEGAQKNRIQVKPFAEGRPPQIIMDMHDNTLGDPAGTISAKYHSSSGQSKVEDDHLDALIEYAEQSVGEERTWAWQHAMLHLTTIIPDALLYHMVGYAAIGPRIEFTPTVFTNSAVHIHTITFNN